MDSCSSFGRSIQTGVTEILNVRPVSYTHLAETYGLQGAVSLRVIQNVFGVVFALAFCVIFYWFMSKKKESDVTVHAE